MNPPAATLISQDQDVVLRQCLEPIVKDRFGAAARIARIAVAPSDKSSWYASYILRVHTSSGANLRVFLKDLGSFKSPKEGMRQRRERERFVYRELLCHSGLGTPEYYASVWDEKKPRFWLLIEFVKSDPLSYFGFEYWLRAAAWLGVMHGYFLNRTADLQTSDILINYAEVFYALRVQ